MSAGRPGLRRVGADALLVECEDAGQVQAWRRELWHRRAAGEFTAMEIVPGARTVLIDGVPDAAGLARRLSRWVVPQRAPAGPGGVLEIPVRFDGPDLDFVAGHWRAGRAGVVRLLCATPLQVAFCGFAPGFGYLSGLPAQPAVPRLPTPRTRVPAGAVGLAGAYAGIYPTASPGGWRLVGRTELALFDPDRRPPALLSPGTRVRLVAIDPLGDED